MAQETDIKDISIINNKVLKVRTLRVVINKIGFYTLSGGFGVQHSKKKLYQLKIDRFEFYFSEKHKKALEKIVTELDYIIAHPLITREEISDKKLEQIIEIPNAPRLITDGDIPLDKPRIDQPNK